MRKLALILLALSAPMVVHGQRVPLSTRMKEKNILSHMDLGISVGTTGIGIDLAVPVTNYVRVRAGYSYMPPIKLHSNFPIETRNGSIKNLINKADEIDDFLASNGVDINSEGFEDIKSMVDKFRNIEAKDYVSMNLKPNMHQFKFLVDIMPFKHNKHWSFTAGFFIGPSNVGSADNMEKEKLILEAVNAYNGLYAQYPENGIHGNYLQPDGTAKSDPFFKYGIAGFPLGNFKDGERAMMVPNKDNTVHAELEVAKFRPYVGLGFNTHLSRNKKWNLNVDAGVLFITGDRRVYVDNVYKFDASPLVMDENDRYVSGIGYFNKYNEHEYYGEIVRFDENGWVDDNGITHNYVDCSNVLNHVDLCNDMGVLFNGKVRDMVDIIKKLKVYPNVSISVSYRLY